MATRKRVIRDVSGPSAGALAGSTALIGTYAQRATGLAVRDKWPTAERDAVFITRFGAGHGWTSDAGTGSMNLNDTATPGPFGFQSVQMVNGAAGGSHPELNKSGLSIDMSASQSLLLWVKVSSIANLTPGSDALLYVYAGDSGFANYHFWVKTIPTNRADWYCIELHKGTADAVGTPPSTLTRISIRCVNGGTGGMTMNVGALARRPTSAVYPNGLVTFSFDDSPVSMFTEARAKLSEYGYSAVAAIITDFVDLDANFVTTAQLRQLQEVNEWEVCGHSKTVVQHDARYTNLTDAELEVEFRGMKEWLTARGFPSEAWAAPGAATNDAVWAIGRKYFNLTRSAGGTVGAGRFSAPPANITNITTMSWFTGTTPVATCEAQIALAKSSPSWLIFNFHSILAGASSGQAIGRADFATIVAKCASEGVAVRTFAQVRAETG